MPIPVTKDNFTRAETDHYFGNFVAEGGLGKLVHSRELAEIAHQKVVRMNRDTLYSSAVFDLDAGPVTVALPDARGRFMSVLVIDEDHYVLDTFYDDTPHRFERGETRYIAVLIRAFVDPADPEDLAAVHALQDAVRIEQPGGPGSFDVPDWDAASLAEIRASVSTRGGFDPSRAFGKRGEVDPVAHLAATAMGWGGNPARDASYLGVEPANNDGTTAYELRVKDVPVDGFWSVTVYNKDGYFERNPQSAYSINNVTAGMNRDGSFTIRFGGCDEGVRNCLPITPGWNYTVRLYRPRAEILDGSWKFPEAQPVG